MPLTFFSYLPGTKIQPKLVFSNQNQEEEVQFGEEFAE